MNEMKGAMCDVFAPKSTQGTFDEVMNIPDIDGSPKLKVIAVQ